MKKIKPGVVYLTVIMSALPIVLLHIGVIIIIFAALPIGYYYAENRNWLISTFLPRFIIGIGSVILVCTFIFIIIYSLINKNIIFKDDKIVIIKKGNIKFEIKIDEIEDMIYIKPKWYHWLDMADSNKGLLIIKYLNGESDVRVFQIRIFKRTYKFLINNLKYNIIIKKIK